MPVTGLPAAAEMSLNALLTINNVSSWKLVGEGDSTVFVLRLRPTQSSSSTTNMANPQPSVCYRRKPPSQIRRDQNRAKRHQEAALSSNYENKASETTVHQEFALFEDNANFVPESENINIGLDKQNLSTTEQSTAEASTKITDPNPVCELPSTQDFRRAPVGGGTVGYTGSMFDTYTPEDPCLISARVAGFSPTTIKDYVATFTDRKVQRLLRTDCRNRDFKRVVRGSKDLKELLVFESDDIVLEYDVTMERIRRTFWFVKRQSMLVEEDEILKHLTTWKTIGDTSFLPARARALQHLHILRDVIAYYLG